MFYNPRASSPSIRSPKCRPRPLIHSAKNSWSENKICQKSGPYSAEELECFDFDSDEERKPIALLQHGNPSPRTWRITLVVVVLLLCAWTVYTKFVVLWTHEVMEDIALSSATEHAPLGNMSAHMPPKFDDVVLLADLNEKFVPSTGKQKHHKHAREQGRLIIVGDVHGMKQSLVQLLEKVGFDKGKDHLVLAGDMISKGPDSVGVLDLIMGLGESASAVRGNHEDRIILSHAQLHSGKSLHHTQQGGEEGPENKAKKGAEKDRELAKQLKNRHIQWLKKCPVILRVGEIEGMGEVVVVHAGLVPGQALEEQDPWFVMNMRTMDLKTRVPSEARDGTPWAKFWNKHQKSLPKHKRSTVIYGHDSKRGLNIHEYTKGIDTGCLKGGKLTALVIEGGQEEARQTLVHVKCKDGRP